MSDPTRTPVNVCRHRTIRGDDADRRWTCASCGLAFAPTPAPDVERLARAIKRAAREFSSYDWDWVLEPDAIAAIAREYAKP